MITDDVLIDKFCAYIYIYIYIYICVCVCVCVRVCVCTVDVHAKQGYIEARSRCDMWRLSADMANHG